MTENLLQQLDIYKFNFRLMALEDMDLPAYKGSMFRGAFGTTFRKAVCVTKEKNCSNCILNSQCSYFNIFETEVEQHDIWFLKGVKKTPHPFVINPPLDGKTIIKKGEILSTGLTVFGSAIKYFPLFVYVFQKMGASGIGVNRKTFQLLEVNNLPDEFTQKVIFHASSNNLIISFNTYKWLQADHCTEQITLNFLTPFRVQAAGEVITDPAKITAELIISSIKRRILILTKLFGKGAEMPPKENDVNDIMIAENKLQFFSLERFSSRQDKKIPLSGFTGCLTLKGNIAPYLSLLKLGENINIGKNTVFGLGAYRILIDK